MNHSEEMFPDSNTRQSDADVSTVPCDTQNIDE